MSLWTRMMADHTGLQVSRFRRLGMRIGSEKMSFRPNESCPWISMARGILMAVRNTRVGHGNMRMSCGL